ncbi:MAG: hypothetical protein QOJ47_2288 [Gaiellales bacterium]|nr:hypothetical protein [Gaiellales bacterium]
MCETREHGTTIDLASEPRARQRPLKSSSVKKLTERERATGIDPEDDASKWLQERDPPPPPAAPKAATKSKALHRWRQEQLKKKR